MSLHAATGTKKNSYTMNIHLRRFLFVAHLLSLFALVSPCGAQVQRWDFSGRIIDVLDPIAYFADLRPGDTIEGHFQYVPTTTGQVEDCNGEFPPYVHLQNRLSTGIHNFSVLSFEIRNPRTNETYTPIPENWSYLESEAASDSQDGLSLVEVREYFGATSDEFSFGNATVFLLGETEIDPTTMPRDISLDAYPDAALEFFILPDQDEPDDIFDLLFVEFSAAIFELQPAEFDPQSAVNPGPLVSMRELPISRPGYSGSLPLTFNPEAISQDGSVVVGDSRVGQHWTHEYGLESIPFPAGFGRNNIYDMDAAGEFVVGELSSCEPLETRQRVAYRWTEKDGYELMGVPDGFDISRAQAISADGSTIAGSAAPRDGDNVYWTWTEETGFTVQSALAGTPRALSADGQIVVDSRGNVLTPDGPINLGGMGDDERVAPQDMSADGSVIVGGGLRPSDASGGAFRWTATDGLMPLGTLNIEGHDRSTAYAVSPDGRVVIGRSYSSNPEIPDDRGFIWDAENGMRELKTVLADEYSVDNIPDTGLGFPVEFSDDGLAITGYSDSVLGDRSSPNTPWIIYLDRPLGPVDDVLFGDFSLNGEYDVDDADTLVAAILSASTDKRFDLRQDGDLNLDDLDELLTRASRLAGDVDFDGDVDFADFLSLSGNFGGEGLWSKGDFDASGDIGFADFLMLSQNFGKAAVVVANVPEPCLAPFLFVSMAWLLRMPLQSSNS